LGLSFTSGAWLRSGNENNANNANLLNSSGGNNNGNTNSRFAVRPALQLYRGKFFLIKPRKPALLGLSFTSDAWLRSGNENNANNAYNLNSNGGNNNNNTNNRYAVRPALHSSVKNFSADNSRIPFV
jgi:K+-transporting ATPase c subunit